MINSLGPVPSDAALRRPASATRRRLFLRAWELKIIKIDGFRTARKRTKAGKRVKKSQTPV